MPTRRTFLAGAAAGLAATAFPSCARSRREESLEIVRPAGPHDAAWDAIRNQFSTDPGVAYLNNASLGMPPKVVADAVARGYALHSTDPLHAKHELSEIVTTRSIPNLARFVGAEPDEIGLTRNATEALHLAAVGLALRPGDEVVITTQEHPAGARPWQFRKTRHGIVVKEVFIPSPFESGEQVVDLMTAAISPRTRAMSFCHVTRGGHLYPVKALCAAARARGIATSVDGAQALGMVPLVLHDLGWDAYSASLHKWLLGPISTGLMYVRRDARDRWQSTFEPAPTLDAPAYAPGGTADLPLRAAIDTAVEFVDAIGIDRIAERDRMLSDYLKTTLGAIDHATLVSGTNAATSAPGSTIFVLDGVDPLAAVAALDRQRLYIDEHVRDGHPAIRVSTHFYNTEDQIDRVVAALTELIP